MFCLQHFYLQPIKLTLKMITQQMGGCIELEVKQPMLEIIIMVILYKHWHGNSDMSPKLGCLE